MNRAIAALTIVYLFAGLLVVLVLDYLFGATAINGFHVLAVSASAAIGGLGWWFTSRRLVALATLIVAGGVIALKFVAISPVKPFRAFYQQLEPGMSMEAVLEELDRAFPAQGRYVVPTVHRSEALGREAVAFTLDRFDGRYNSEIISTRFDQGGLTTAEYLPD